MINYTEKGIGLHEAIQAAGHWLAQHDGVWVSDNDVAVQAIIDGYTMAQTADEIKARIDEYAASLRGKVTATVAPAEMASWTIKRAEAEAYQANNAAATPFLSAESTARGVTVADLATRVLNNAAVLQSLEAQIAGNSGKHRDALTSIAADSTKTFADLLAYDWSTGWPMV